MIMANLWAKQLIVDDTIINIKLVEHYKFGPIKRFDVERSDENYRAELEREKLNNDNETAEIIGD